MYTVKYKAKKFEIDERIILRKSDFYGLIINKGEDQKLAVYPFSPGFLASKLAKIFLLKNNTAKGLKNLEKEITDFIILNKFS